MYSLSQFACVCVIIIFLKTIQYNFGYWREFDSLGHFVSLFFLSFILLIIAFLIEYVKSSKNRKRALQTELHFKGDQATDMTWQKCEILALGELKESFEVDFPEVFHFTLNSPNIPLEVCYCRNHYLSLHCTSVLSGLCMVSTQTAKEGSVTKKMQKKKKR